MPAAPIVAEGGEGLFLGHKLHGTVQLSGVDLSSVGECGNNGCKTLGDIVQGKPSGHQLVFSILAYLAAVPDIPSGEMPCPVRFCGRFARQRHKK